MRTTCTPAMASYYWAGVGLASAGSLFAWFIGSALFAVLDVEPGGRQLVFAAQHVRQPADPCLPRCISKEEGLGEPLADGLRPIDRCGAPTNSRGENREENPISGFDFDDDIPLLELRTGRRSDDLNLPAYWGAFPLINTALNLVATRELDWQERLAESFVLSPLYCGSESTGYQPLPDDFRRGNMTLGRAVAISGAAADPNMGHHTTTAVMALMTVFNTRLGWWIENPSRPVHRLEDGPIGAVGRRESIVRWPDPQGADRPNRLGRRLDPPLRRRPLREPRRLRAHSPPLSLHRRERWRL